MARRMVNAGAGILINLTNDAWFLDSKEPYLHLQAAVFRAVENRRDLIRAANTGVSCFISSRGEIRSVLTAPDGDATYIEGAVVAPAVLSDEKTFYTRHGDLFVLFCAAFFVLGVIFLKE